VRQLAGHPNDQHALQWMVLDILLWHDAWKDNFCCTLAGSRLQLEPKHSGAISMIAPADNILFEAIRYQKMHWQGPN